MLFVGYPHVHLVAEEECDGVGLQRDEVGWQRCFQVQVVEGGRPLQPDRQRHGRHTATRLIECG